MNIHSKIRDYTLSIAQDFSLLDPVLALDKAFFVVDRNVFQLYRDLFTSLPDERTFLLEAREEEKTIDAALSICERMTGLNAKRNARLVSFGGGITQDVTGFAANVLYRGVHWTFVPTTLLAACDSCIGGKTSLNYKGFKNLLGTFYPPAEILICPLFFNTLSQEDFLSGLGEVVKFNFLMGSDGVENIEQNLDALLARDPSVVNRFVESSLLYKKGYIEEDEFDNGVRVFLNFAHTFGHAIESASEYAIPHGTAVAMGMIAANHVSVLRGLLTEPDARRMERTLRRIIPQSAFSHVLDADRLTAAIRNDKKQIGGGITAVLMDENAKLALYHDLTPQEVRAAYVYLAGGN